MPQKTENSARIVCIVGDPSTHSELQDYLAGFGFRPFTANSIGDAIANIQRQSAALCILDLDAARVDRASAIRDISTRSACPLIAVSGNSEMSDRVIGLELGADDYLAKPYEPRELVARMRSVLRRSERTKSDARDAQSTALFGDWTFDAGSLDLIATNGRSETLTAAEAALLLQMIKRPNRLLTREQLQASDDWTDDPAYARSIDVRVSRIRKKIESDPRAPRYIKTVYGAGYIFSANVIWK